MINKKVGTIALGLSLMLSASTQVLAFGLGGLGGSALSSVTGGGTNSNTNWGNLASTGQNAEKDIYGGTRLMALSTLSMADALGYKSEAASLNSQVKKMSEDGSVSGDFDLGETTKMADSVMDKIIKDKAQLTKIDEKQKKKLGKAMEEYSIGGFKYITGAKAISDVASKAGNAPMSEMMKFAGMIKLVPTTIKGAQHLFGKIGQVVEVMRAADVAVPDDMDNLTSDF